MKHHPQGWCFFVASANEAEYPDGSQSLTIRLGSAVEFEAKSSRYIADNYNVDLHASQLRVRRRAFTLIEMMIVVLIVSIIGAMAVARMGDTSVTQLRSAASLLVADLGFAQVESIGHAADLRVVVFDVAGNSYHIASASSSETPITHPISKAPYEVRFGEGAAHALTAVSISTLSVGGDAQLQFGVYGQLDQATAATVTLITESHSVTITIHPVTGEATIGDIVAR